jgi:hypothetical protein
VKAAVPDAARRTENSSDNERRPCCGEAELLLDCAGEAIAIPSPS